MVVAIHHIQLLAPPQSEHAAHAFYGELLGMAEIEKSPELKKRGGVWFEVGDQQIHVSVVPDFQPARKAHPALVVAGLDALRERLNAAGYETQDDDLFLGYRRFYAHDPFGNRLEFLEPQPVG